MFQGAVVFNVEDVATFKSYDWVVLNDIVL